MRHKYDPLHDYLSRATSERVRFSFAAIEKMLQESLPKSAYSYREWWANQSNMANRPQAAAWLESGWKVDSVLQNKVRAWVEFVRS
jgi:hypothetical protein